ncbi:hypothetical protein BsWGS_05139 [Bradybaena similaris]
MDNNTGRREPSCMTHSTRNIGFWRPTVIFFLLLLCLHSEVALSQIVARDKGIQISHQIGTDAVLTCTVQDLGNRRIIWSKQSEPYPISVGSTKFNPAKNYKVVAKGNTSVLTIKQVKLEDAGEYQCRVSGMEQLSDTLTLNIQADYTVAPDTDNSYLLPSLTEIKAEVGETVQLPCRVENLKGNVVLWLDSQNDVLSLRQKVINEDRRLSVWHPNRTEWGLQIKSLRPTDFGLYTCVINSVPVLTRTVRLVNSAPAQLAPILIQDSTFKKRVEVASGETVVLTCNFKANPAANITWHRRRSVSNKLVKDELGSGNTYTLRSVSPEQSGQYICVGDNGIKPAARGKTELIVIGPPTPAPVVNPTTFIAVNPIAPVLYRDQHRTGQRRGDNVEISCSAIGNPRPSIHWTRHHKKIDNNYKYQVSEKHYRHDTTHSTLLVKSLTSPDFGDYMCVGFNIHGMRSVPLEIFVIN